MADESSGHNCFLGIDILLSILRKSCLLSVPLGIREYTLQSICMQYVLRWTQKKHGNDYDQTQYA